MQLFRNETNEWYHVFVNGEEIVCTGGHPFYVVGLNKFLPARELKLYEKVLLSDGKCGTIDSIGVEALLEPEVTYNFEVADYHTYYVGECNVLVHNMCNVDKDFDTYKEAEKYFKDQLGEGAEIYGKTSYGENIYKSADGLKFGYLDKSHHPYRPKGMRISPDHFNVQVKNTAGKVVKNIHIFWGLK